MKPHSYITNKVEVRESGKDRKGVFALQEIAKDEIISIWSGYIVSGDELVSLSETTFKNVYDYAIDIADNFFLVSSRDGTLEDDDFFNHSCEPNAGIKGQSVLVAMRSIAPGEEITYDYAMTDAQSDLSFECHCGSPQCRGYVSSSDWKRRELQQKYRDYFSSYIQGKIDQSRDVHCKF